MIDTAFALLKSAFDGTTPAVEPMGTSQWWSLFRLMQQQHVAAFTHAAAARCEVPREVLVPWLAEREKAVDWYRYRQEVQQDIVNVMQRNGIDARVLKGTHLAQYYPRPELREFGDIDLFFGSRHDEADAVAQRELKVAVDTRPHHHTRYDYRGVIVESHYDFFNRYYPGSNRRYNQMLAAMGPSPTFDVLHFLRHIAIHFADQGLRLRDLCDWACLTAQDSDWHTVETEVKRFGMAPFAATLDGITRRRLGMASPMKGCSPSGAETRMENDIFYGEPQGGAIRQYLHSRWKRRLAFGDHEHSLLVHKAISRLSHNMK